MALVANPLEKQCIIDVLFYGAKPETGRIFIRGNAVAGNVTQQLEERQVAYIGSHLRLLPSLSVSRNYLMYLQHAPGDFLIHDRKLRQKTEQLLEEFGLSEFIHPETIVGQLPFFHVLSLEILMVAEQGARLIVMNDLIDRVSGEDLDKLELLLQMLAGRGVGFLILSNRYSSLFQKFDRLVIVHNGVSTGILRKEEISLKNFIPHFSPHTKERYAEPPWKRKKEIKEPVLQMEEFRLPEDPQGSQLNVSLSQGEVMGMWSEDWNRIFRIGNVLSGNASYSGQIRLLGESLEKRIKMGTAGRGIAVSMSVHGTDKIFPKMSLYDNVTCLAGSEVCNSFGLISSRLQKYMTVHMLELVHGEYLLQKAGNRKELGEISGIDQLRVIAAKWLCTSPKVFVFVNSFIALDDRTITEFSDLVRSLADLDIGVLILSVNREWLDICCDSVTDISKGI